MSADEGVLDQGTRETIAGGRRTVGEMLSALQSDLRRVFIVFLVGFIGSFYGMRNVIWPTLKADLLARGASVVAITPFDVIMLQTKLSVMGGALFSLPFLLYYAREPLKRRGWYPETGVATWKLLGIGVVSIGLFVGGALYAYKVIFPFLFGFLARNAIQAGLQPTYSIVKWTQFVLMLVFAFGLSAQLPLFMTALAYGDIVSAQTFKEKWRHAVLGAFVLGATINGTPEPFSMTLVAGPMVLLYFVGMGCARVVEKLTGRADRTGDPSAIDLDELDADGVRAAPPEAFEDMSEDDALERAQSAIDEDRQEKARAILDRYDEVTEETEDETEIEPDESATEAAAEDDTESESGGPLQRATARVADPFTEDETTEEDIGGYYYDLAFVFDTLRSKSFRILAVFIAVMAVVFQVLYMGGLGAIKRDFIARLPDSVPAEQVDIVTLHPVEALIFEVKISLVLGAVATIPLILYYAWPALKQRGVAQGDRSVFLTWTGAIAIGLLAGSAFGYAFVAPRVVSYLVWQGIQANMVIAYRVSNFFWLVFFTTVGLGLWIDIPVTMLLFHRGGIVRFAAMRDRWRIVTMGVFVAAAGLTPSSVLSMFLVTIPVMLGYLVGLALLWVATLGGRRTSGPEPRPE